MMPQQEANEPSKAQAGADYGKYEGETAYSYQQFEPPYQQPLREESASKLYPPAPDNTNLFRLIAFGMTLVALIVCAMICLLMVGGTGGWISFCAACLTIFIVGTVVIDKIK
ncbi:hypothetical protein [Dictyobacter kobayashii]|uniref:Uncharacterized protein n=1 Tax=Dictyobacter kobayashii TaxID=2014872 RepID=A0A402AYM9_9CHLR|nr:hypothetical protein [Dictyobacter kobayashii]GCE24177.1 hypothetical protein KDK_79770 [Dictyobacter kobayashii]